MCYFCKQRVYVMERLSAEGKFFHRGCFKCDYCGVTLRLGNFAFDVEEGKVSPEHHHKCVCVCAWFECVRTGNFISNMPDTSLAFGLMV